MTHPIPAVPAGSDEGAQMLPCAFCGGKAILRTTEGWSGIGCETDKCPGYLHALMFRTPFDARARWNRRAVPAGSADRVDDLMELARQYAHAYFNAYAFPDRAGAGMLEKTTATLRHAAAELVAAASSASGGQPISDERADAIHSMPWVRDCLLRYVDRPCDNEARDVVRAITNAERGLIVGARPASSAPSLSADGALSWTAADGTMHEVSRDYATRILHWVFNRYGDVDMDEVIESDSLSADARDAQPNLSAINELAKVHASNYASPHHMTFSVEGLRNLIAAMKEQPQ